FQVKFYRFFFGIIERFAPALVYSQDISIHIMHAHQANSALEERPETALRPKKFLLLFDDHRNVAAKAKDFLLFRIAFYAPFNYRNIPIFMRYIGAERIFVLICKHAGMKRKRGICLIHHITEFFSDRTVERKSQIALEGFIYDLYIEIVIKYADDIIGDNEKLLEIVGQSISPLSQKDARHGFSHFDKSVYLVLRKVFRLKIYHT